jgi:hypothetical protein
MKMGAVNRKENYKKLRNVGYSPTSATILKDYKEETIQQLINCALESMPDVKKRFAEILGKDLKIDIVFEVE